MYDPHGWGKFVTTWSLAALESIISKKVVTRGSHIVEFVTQRTFSNTASGEKFAIADSAVSLEIRFIW